ncbi:MAG: hypothetical protein IKI84_09030 [Clostridia bacterium]|nr:hypothetical protein [Clostridia bacterium]
MIDARIAMMIHGVPVFKYSPAPMAAGSSDRTSAFIPFGMINSSALLCRLRIVDSPLWNLSLGCENIFTHGRLPCFPDSFNKSRFLIKSLDCKMPFGAFMDRMKPALIEPTVST